MVVSSATTHSDTRAVTGCHAICRSATASSTSTTVTRARAATTASGAQRHGPQQAAPRGRLGRLAPPLPPRPTPARLPGEAAREAPRRRRMRPCRWQRAAPGTRTLHGALDTVRPPLSPQVGRVLRPPRGAQLARSARVASARGPWSVSREARRPRSARRRGRRVASRSVLGLIRSILNTVIGVAQSHDDAGRLHRGASSYDDE